jgi:hypothetical protein
MLYHRVFSRSLGSSLSEERGPRNRFFQEELTLF